MRRIGLTRSAALLGVTVLIGLKAAPTARALGWSAPATPCLRGALEQAR